MYIMVIGGGKVGYYLAKALLDEGHEALVLEKDPRRVDVICNELGSLCLRGDGCEPAVLEAAGIERADMLIAVTGDDEDNLVSCQVAKHMFKVQRTVARISNPKNETIFRKLGIDTTISSTLIILEYIQEEVPTHPLTHLLTIREKGLEIVEVKIPPDSVIVGTAVKDISLPPSSVLILIIGRGEHPQVPTDNTTIQAEDHIIAVTPPESEHALRAALGVI